MQIVHYWNREEIPDHISGCLATFREHNPEMTQLVFNERTAEELIAEHYGGRHLEAFRACAVPAMQADYFRYCAVHALGGVYTDANAACLLPLEPLLKGEGCLFGDAPRVLNNFFAFRSPGHPFLALAVEVATTNIENRISENVALTTGPIIFSGLVGLHRDGSLDAIRESAGRWRPLLDSCLEPLLDSFEKAIEAKGPLDGALEGVHLSTRAEMLTRVHKPEYRYETPEPHWAHRKGSIYRSREGQTPA